MEEDARDRLPDVFHEPVAVAADVPPAVGRADLTGVLETKARKRSTVQSVLTTPFSVLFFKPYVKPLKRLELL